MNRILLLLFLLLCISIDCFAIDVKEVSAIQLSKIVSDPSYQVIDNRPNFKFSQGHIKGALNYVFFDDGASENTLTKDILAKITKNKIVILHCTGFSRSPNALSTAIEKWKIPSDRLILFRGGIQEWVAKGFSLVK